MKRNVVTILLSLLALSPAIARPQSPDKETSGVSDSIYIRSLEELMLDIKPDSLAPKMNLYGIPKVFTGYRAVGRHNKPQFQDSIATSAIFKELYFKETPDSTDSVATEPLSIAITGDVVPEWLSRNRDSFKRQLDLQYLDMVYNPSQSNPAFWTLPLPPTLPPEDYSYAAFLRRQRIKVNLESAIVPEIEIEKKHWLHLLNISLQFSQAYLSKNWYQGGNNYLALLGNFLWDVQLNPVYHPNMMFQSTLSYKLGLNSTEDNVLHKYSISEDLFQYNLKFGYKAAHHWYYSFTGQFKTQMLNNYPSDSMVRTASFLTPGVLTLGLGMTYTKQNEKKTIDFNASISPISYNLKTAIDPNVDHLQFGIDQDKKCVNEFGSSAELTFNWKLLDNILYKTRLFLFTDYKQSNADWQNTFEFQFSRFFSTQLYLNLRYDSTADKSLDPKWNRWMLKEILSVGLSYTFSTKI